MIKSWFTPRPAIAHCVPVMDADMASTVDTVPVGAAARWVESEYGVVRNRAEGRSSFRLEVFVVWVG